MAAATSADHLRAGRRRQALVVLGFGLTALGAFLVSAALPSGPAALARALPYLAGGLPVLWLGGILMGFAVGRRRRAGAG